MAAALPAPFVSTLEEGRTAYVAVAASSGPHVTPELFAWSGDRLWFAAAASTLKASVLAKRPEAGVVVAGSAGTVVLRGEVEVLDPRNPASALRIVRDLPATVAGLARFTARNVSDLVAFGADAISGRLGSRIPPVRVLYGLEAAAAVLVVNDTVTQSWGAWAGSESSAGDDHVVPAGGEQAVAAFPGPVAVPARWFADQEVAYVAPPLLGLLDLPETFPISVVADDYRAPGPAAKRGILVRGQGTRSADEPGFLQIDGERVVVWDGVDTDSAEAT